MCEYCGCQALTVIDELTREHDAVINLFADVRAAVAEGRTDKAAEIARAMAAILGPHTMVEEKGLFPFLAEEFPEQVSTLEHEHREIEAVLAEAAVHVPHDPTWPGRLLEAIALLRDHILKEQDGAFPAALTTLTGDDWETIESLRRG
jgi:hemerythrin-like domain-containing protein